MKTSRRQSSRGKSGFVPKRVFAVDVAEGLADRNGAGRYEQALVLVRNHGRPLGCIEVPYRNGRLLAKDLEAAIAANGGVTWCLGRDVLRRWLLRRQPEATASLPSWSVIVCTRNRAEQLGRCLEALVAARIERGEIVIVDNDPSDDLTRQLVARYPGIRYVREPRRGLNWARSCGARAATGEVLLYTDDDVVVDQGWIRAMLEPFAGSSRVAAVTGFTMPFELETRAQALFEQWGGHGRGFERRVFDQTVIPPAASGLVGHGGNMAIRRELVIGMGLFDTEMDVGTVTQSGGDAYAFYCLLAAGYQIVYTPQALVWHQHRRDDEALRRMLYGYSVGAFAFLTRALVCHRDWQALEVGLSWLRKHHIKGLARSLKREPGHLPLNLIVAEWLGVLVGPWAHVRSRRAERVRREQALRVAQEAVVA